MKILLATDAWSPQINGVVKTLGFLIAELKARGHDVCVVIPSDFPTMPLPMYHEIRLAWPSPSVIRRKIAEFAPDHVHIATEGPIGWATRHVCLNAGHCFTTSYHTRFPEYIQARAPIPLGLSYAALRTFHNAGQGVMVATASIEEELAARGFNNLVRWSRGVDLERFRPEADASGLPAWPRPIFLTVGRLAPEKNLDAFLSLDLPGTKVVIGDGPLAAVLCERHRQAVFLGARRHEDLPAFYAHADAFVFPSMTDTFGLVLIEAMACGLPVAAFPVAGPRDVVAGAGALSHDLKQAALSALRIDRRECRRHALGFTWHASADQFLANVARAQALWRTAQKTAA